MDPKILITSKEELNPKHKKEQGPFEYIKYEVTKRKEWNDCYIAIYEIPPKKKNFPFHYHDFNTEAFYIISGTGILRTKNHEQEIKGGDIIVCPPKEEGVHQLINTSPSENLVYIDFDTTNSPDIIHYPDSDKLGVVVHNESSTFFKNTAKVDYYTDENNDSIENKK